MAKNVEMTVKQADGSYETIYPQTLVENISDIGDSYYNKNQTLSGTTAQQYGLSSDATPDQVFQKISEGPDFSFFPGDILETARTNVGDKWLLCNGDTVSTNDYPDLSAVFPTKPNTTFSSYTYSTVPIIESMAYGNGIYVFSGWNDTDSHYEVYYSTSLISNNWTKLTPNCIPYGNQPIRVGFVNNYFYAAIITSGADNPILYSISASSLNSTNSWSSTSALSQCDIYRFDTNKIVYIDGKYIYPYTIDNSPHGTGVVNCDVGFSYSTSLSSSSWTRKTLYTDTSEYEQAVYFTYLNGYYICGSNRKIYYSTNFSGSYNNLTVGNAGDTNNLFYVNGYYVTDIYNTIYYSSSFPTSSWQSQKILTSGEIKDFIYDGIYLIALGSSSLSFSESPQNSWTSGTQGGEHILSNNDYYLVQPQTYSTNINYLDKSTIILPTISSPTNLYSYIKAKR